uniref:hypothetical protein n=1 Tax=Prevotella sp. TaxID=59823 RepID=UPI004026D613
MKNSTALLSEERRVMSEEFNSLLKKEKSKIENSTSAESRQFKNQNSKLKTPIAQAIHSPLRRGGGS